MKKSICILCISSLLCSPFTAFAGPSGNTQASASETEYQPPSLRREIRALQKGDWIHLTTEQKLEDLDLLYQTLKENYPYFHTLKRMRDADLDQKYRKARGEIRTSNTDISFYQQLDEFINTNDQIGHLLLHNPYWFEETADSYRRVAADYPDSDRMQKLAAAYNNPKSLENYKKMRQVTDPAYDKVMDYYASLESAQTDEQESVAANVQTRIIKEGSIAYIKIDRFLSGNEYGEDKKQLFDFYHKVRGYDHIIFDLTDNGGGSMDYFNDLIASPNIDSALTCNAYGLIKGGENNRIFLDMDQYRPVSEFPDLPRTNQEDLSDTDFFHDIQYTVDPAGGGKMLSGKLWMLVSDTVFSSSEYAAMFSKATGFMTLVGTQTGGEGIGSDPLPIILPNSGLIVQYAPVYGVMPDGSGSQECKTALDIRSADGETALNACLRAIAEQ